MRSPVWLGLIVVDARNVNIMLLVDRRLINFPDAVSSVDLKLAVDVLIPEIAA